VAHTDLVQRLTGGRSGQRQMQASEASNGDVGQAQQGDVDTSAVMVLPAAKKSLKLRPVKRQPYRR
jgi:hypothetical protein